ncbi:hypothetical protein E2542_SST03651 [Spatholobus suberectus]|nr:hypothetical protein E2542_SST03651 [Spatholobus suberectus]
MMVACSFGGYYAEELATTAMVVTVRDGGGGNGKGERGDEDEDERETWWGSG